MEKNSTIINLDSLLNFSARLNETYDEYLILNSALLSLMGKLKIFRACALVPDTTSGFKVLISKGSNLSTINPMYEKINSKLNASSLDNLIPILNESGYANILRIIYRDKLLSVLCLSDKINGEVLTDEEERYSDLVCIITANALQNARNYHSLIREKNLVEMRNQLLSTLFDISRDFSSLISRDQIIKMLSHQLMGQLMISRFAIILLNENGTHEIIVNRFSDKPSQDMLNCIISSANFISISNFEDSNCIAAFMKKIDASIIAHMKIHGKVKGVLIVGNKMTGEKFSDENLQFIEALSNIATTALENERLFVQELEKKRLENELSMALEIQRNLLPKELPEIPGYSIAGLSIPSRHVGGDYYDIIKLPDGKIMIVIADVSGKGMPAALIMANVQAALRILASLKTEINDVVLQINNIVYQNTSADKFITFFCGILDPSERTFHYINAGHNPPVLLNSEVVKRRLDKGGLILGFLESPLEYQSEVVNLSSGDTIFFYTDGVSEAQNVQCEELGIEPSIKILMKNSDKTSRDLLNMIVENVFNYFENGVQQDDITCVLLKAE